MSTKTIYYEDELNDDFSVTVKNLNPLPDDYIYENNSVFEKIFGFIAYQILLRPFAFLYMKIAHHHKFINKKAIKNLKSGCIIYANHSLPLGDVFLPSLIDLKRKNYLLAGEQANSLTKVLWIMRSIGSLPVTKNPCQNIKLTRCMKNLIKKKSSITIYPEAHVWPYYTQIRNYTSTSFKYPSMMNCPAFSMTTCYKKRKFGKKPKVITYIDGPFYPDSSKTQKENAEYLKNTIFNIMSTRTHNESTYAYYEYIEKK